MNADDFVWGVALLIFRENTNKLVLTILLNEPPFANIRLLMSLVWKFWANCLWTCKIFYNILNYGKIANRYLRRSQKLTIFINTISFSKNWTISEFDDSSFLNFHPKISSSMWQVNIFAEFCFEQEYFTLKGTLLVLAHWSYDPFWFMKVDIATVYNI